MRSKKHMHNKNKQSHKQTKTTTRAPMEKTFPEQTGKKAETDAYAGDDKHGPMEEEAGLAGDEE